MSPNLGVSFRPAMDLLRRSFRRVSPNARPAFGQVVTPLFAVINRASGASDCSDWTFLTEHDVEPGVQNLIDSLRAFATPYLTKPRTLGSFIDEVIESRNSPADPLNLAALYLVAGRSEEAERVLRTEIEDLSASRHRVVLESFTTFATALLEVAGEHGVVATAWRP